MPKINFKRLAFYAVLFWLLINLCWSVFIIKFEPNWILRDPLIAFLGVYQLSWISQKPYMVIYFIFVTFLLFYWWARRPSLFKALLLIGFGPYIGLFAFSGLFAFVYSPFWLVGFIVAAYGIRWANTGKFTPIMEK